MKFRTLAAIFSFLLITGCEKTIQFPLKSNEQKLVVEATIENGTAPMVTLTRSVGYFDKLDVSLLTGSFVHGAEVYISNGTLTHKLKEYTVPLAPGIAVYYYSTDSANLATAFTGELNHHYSLRIVSEGKEYTSSTTIPAFAKQIDSLWWKQAPATTDTTKVLVMVRATDPPGYGDYIRYFIKLNRQSTYLPPYNSVFDDLFIDGTTYEVELEKGADRNKTDTISNGDHDFFHRGDTVNFKLSDIDKATYDFWRTWEYSYASVGNPFSTPTKVLGNISNGALGYFGGYASQYRTLIIPH